MLDHIFKKTMPLLSAAGLACGVAVAQAAPLPDPLQDEPLAKNAASRTLVLAGGCFWGIEAVFQHVKGVTGAVSGYAGGSARSARYEIVSLGMSDHAESVEVTYDPAQISAGKLLKIFFSVAHDPTQLNRQGPDSGPQYRSAVFFTTPEQGGIARAYIAQLDGAKAFTGPIVTEVKPLEKFYPAEAYHQDYVRKNPGSSYVVFNDLPKVAHLRKAFPELYVEGK